MTSDERAAREIVDELLGPGGQGEDLAVRDIVAALRAEREACLKPFEELVAKWLPDGEGMKWGDEPIDNDHVSHRDTRRDDHRPAGSSVRVAMTANGHTS